MNGLVVRMQGSKLIVGVDILRQRQAIGLDHGSQGRHHAGGATMPRDPGAWEV